MDEVPVSVTTAGPLQRRLGAEWALLQQLVAENHGRLHNALWQDTEFFVTLEGVPAYLATDGGPSSQKQHTQHFVRITYPSFFPALPMELYLREPVYHPNVHPETGFVCLWDRHRTTNTIEHALHKLVAILGWRLVNAEAVHVMQPHAEKRMEKPEEWENLRTMLHANELIALHHNHSFAADVTTGPRRRRLS